MNTYRFTVELRDSIESKSMYVTYDIKENHPVAAEAIARKSLRQVLDSSEYTVESVSYEQTS
jgi:hypothetical protein